MNEFHVELLSTQNLDWLFFFAITFEIEFHDCVVLCDLTNFDRIKKSTFNSFLSRIFFILLSLIGYFVLCVPALTLCVTMSRRVATLHYAPRCKHIFYVKMFHLCSTGRFHFIGFICSGTSRLIKRSINDFFLDSQSIMKSVKLTSNFDSDQRFVIY